MDRKRQQAASGSADQIERFKETAHALGCDEDEAAFDEKLKAIARQKPKDERGPAVAKKAPKDRR